MLYNTCYVMLYNTYVMLYNTCYVMLYNMLCYITHVISHMICYVTHVMLCYVL